ncbi:hypothetical protein CYMTET_33520 [Cymbomonas tetramitiformis]|uniref:Prolyl 4-hydroxylase alpha subunit Fe(2+) 2OG dioxygenase domain-containing protein n=1 Tax=Cymbomonas tetramitiformis TaxID=36881 RepID=A0AAE0KQV6_9CHLO|nr:hypothetical protein CYMTET_33520 [Cymbomonas tetramitiformis]
MAVVNRSAAKSLPGTTRWSVVFSACLLLLPVRAHNEGFDPADNSTQESDKLSVLQRGQYVEVQSYPFPHIIIPNALPTHIYDRLVAAFPSDRTVVGLSNGAKPMRSNTRYHISARRMLSATKRGLCDPIWRDFVKYHTSSRFFQEVVQLFGSAIQAEWPRLLNATGKTLGSFAVGTRGDTRDSVADLQLDCQVGINSPVRYRRSSVRGPHVDKLDKMFSALLYLRVADDTSTGGDLNLYSCPSKCSPTTWMHASFSHLLRMDLPPASGEDYYYNPSDLSLEVRCPYAANTLVLFVNSERAIHAVSSRSVTPVSRKLVNFIGTVPLTRYTPPLSSLRPRGR